MKVGSSSDRARQIFLRNLKFQLLSPVEAIVEYSEMLMSENQGKEDNPFSEDLRNIHASGGYLRAYIKGIIENPEINEEIGGMHDFGARVRHELRTHLNHIIGYSEIFLEEAEDGGWRGSTVELEKIHASSCYLLLHMDDLLDLSKLSSGQEETDMAVSDAVAQSVVQDIAPLMRERRAEHLSGWVLVVDDNEINRDLLATRLKRQGHKIDIAINGEEALRKIANKAYDLIILEIMMAGINGFQVLKRLREDENFPDIPVMVISAINEIDSVVRCLEMGAEDYLVKPIHPVVIQARVKACLEKKFLRDRERLYLQEIQSQNEQIEEELFEAAEYVRSLLPPVITEGDILTQWQFIPSSHLGGDSFGYHWLDADHFVMYLLDVCGHGVGSALLSVSVMNFLGSDAPNTAYKNPSLMMHALNDTFRMEDHNGKYFTIWYGVFHKKQRTLSYSCCGHPPAILMTGARDGKTSCRRLTENNCRQLAEGGTPIIGLTGQDFPSDTVSIGKGDRVFIFSDGIYEIQESNGNVLGYDLFLETFVPATHNAASVEQIVRYIQKTFNVQEFDDDVSMLAVSFR